MRRSVLPISAIVLVLAAAAAGAQSKGALQVRAGTGGISFLTDGAGMTLYYYTRDADGQSACSANCLNSWPVFYAENLTLPASLVKADFAVITRADGTKQTTYKGWPLYYFARDASPGDTTGEGVNKVWYIVRVPAYTVMVSTSATLGNYLVDGVGRTLYWYTRDTPGQSVCDGNCIKNWPAFYAATVSAPSAMVATDFATITRADGTRQTTFRGYPLYYWVRDEKRNDATGQDVGKVWYVIDPAAFPPPKS